ncbi:uncharacterized protein B0T23DRAFT_71517 [Neurospora hispaniola]|uniref:Uncharacterized protein n=1 Tax=Neurospora hispaniola TaxID=588809 RepID=A0AAJ0ICX2_9PEZI|nr:hypothetical protein B0T23DRAFT_71517 [Neurospora hispaniola]
MTIGAQCAYVTRLGSPIYGATKRHAHRRDDRIFTSFSSSDFVLQGSTVLDHQLVPHSVSAIHSSQAGLSSRLLAFDLLILFSLFSLILIIWSICDSTAILARQKQQIMILLFATPEISIYLVTVLLITS